MKKINLIFKNTLTYTSWFLIVVSFSLIGSVLGLMPKTRRYKSKIFYFISYMTGKLMIKTSFIKLNISGLENLPIDRNQPAVLTMNHSSAMDIPMIGGLMGMYPHTWVSRAEFSKIPIFGFVLRRFNVLVNKMTPKEAVKTIVNAVEISGKNNTHLLIFPEGQRYDDNKIHKFYNGFAIIAKQLKRPVIPILIMGLHKIYPKNSKIINSNASDVNVVIGKPMFYNDQEDDINAFVTRVQKWFEEELAKRG